MTLTTERIEFLRALAIRDLNQRERIEATELMNAAKALIVAGLELSDVATLVELVRAYYADDQGESGEDCFCPLCVKARPLIARLPK